jgi:hypothetical protein
MLPVLFLEESKRVTSTASSLSNDQRLSTPGLFLLQLLSLLHAAGVFVVRVASFESLTTNLIHPQPAHAAGSLVLESKPGNNAPQAHCQPSIHEEKP